MLNAQLLSSIYVAQYLHMPTEDIRASYEILSNQVGTDFLYPMPLQPGANLAQIESEFLTTQKRILWAKYLQTIQNFVQKYVIKFGKLIPVPDFGKTYPDSYFVGSADAIQIRKYDLSKVFNNRRKREAYYEMLREADISYGILDLLNEMFDNCCTLDIVTESLQSQLYDLIAEDIIQSKAKLNDFQAKLEAGTLNMMDIDSLLQLSLGTFTGRFFELLIAEAHRFVDTLHEMQEFAAAEENLSAFCVAANLPEPTIRLYVDSAENELAPTKKRQFDDRLLGKEEVVERSD